MRQYQGKKITVESINGKIITGVHCGLADDILRILPDPTPDKPDEKREIKNIRVENIFSYSVEGEGVNEGYSGVCLYVCKNDALGCRGRQKLSVKKQVLSDMGCEAIKSPNFKVKETPCDFGCVGNIEIVPSKALRVFLDGMMKISVVGEKKDAAK